MSQKPQRYRTTKSPRRAYGERVRTVQGYPEGDPGFGEEDRHERRDQRRRISVLLSWPGAEALASAPTSARKVKNMSAAYVKLTPSSMFKRRYGKWYLIETARRERERFLAEGGTELVLLSLFRGESVEVVSRNFALAPAELNPFLDELVAEGLIERCDRAIDSTPHCFDVEPPLDSLNALITNVCNLRCQHCYVSSGKRMDGELTGHEWVRVLQEARQLGVFELNVSGGEATLHPDFEQIADHIASVPTFNANLNTNAVMLRPGLEKVIARTFTSVQVSIDYAEAEKHDAFRGRSGAFDRSLRNIARLREAGVETNVGFTLTPESLDSLDGMVELCEDTGVTILNIGLVANLGRASSNGLVQIVTRKSVEQNGFLDRAYRKLRELSQRQSTVKILLPFRLGPEVRTEPKQYICDGDNHQILYVMADGSMMPCDKLPIGSFAYGNAKQQGLAEVWTSSQMKSFKLMGPGQLPKCKDCPHLVVCGGACVARAYQMAGSLDSPDWTSCIIAQKFASEREASA